MDAMKMHELHLWPEEVKLIMLALNSLANDGELPHLHDLVPIDAKNLCADLAGMLPDLAAEAVADGWLESDTPEEVVSEPRAITEVERIEAESRARLQAWRDKEFARMKGERIL